MTSRRSRILASAGFLIVLGTTPAAFFRTPLSASAATGTHVLVQQTVPAVPGATLLGALAPTTPLTIDLAIDSNLAAKQAAVAAVYNTSSPTYHHYYTNATWDAQFSVAQATYSAVVNPLTALGMSVLYSDETRDLVELSATAAQVNTAFSITEQQWQLPSGAIFYVNAQPPTVAADVDAVQGLTNIGFKMKNKPTDNQANCQPDPNGGNMCLGSMEGTDLRNIYNVGTTFTGAGQALAVNGDGDPQGPTNDLHKYETDRSLPAVQTVFVNTDSDPCTASGTEGTCDVTGEGEWALDSTSSTAMAPGVGTLYYFFPSALGNASGFQAWADYNTTANGPIPMQENASWGECESFATTGSNIPIADGSFVTYTMAFVDGAGKGKTTFVSSGDQGGGCTLTGVNGVSNGGPPQIQWPCASEWVVCVGGTVLYTNGLTGAAEARANLNGTCTPTSAVGVLNNCAETAWTHTGGGSSHFRPAQSWQQSLSPFPISGICTLDNNGNPVTSGPVCRGAPDVAALSGDITVAVADTAGNGVPGNGFNDVEGGSPSGAGAETADGGTSLSDPLWEGLWADIQSDPAPGGTWGFAAPLLYQIGENPALDPCAFYDVQIGSNGQNPAIPREAPDVTGWDYVSGLGTPNVGCIESALVASSPNVAESPVVPLLVIPGAGVAALVALMKRRRRQS
ncbi:MAG TPA: S53 family peptidase [Candidatus Acidoferrales bacterium]|jgi:subtilase family serine protease|nr:S53 family peptidase [Candidatus Acidoferrales bacterium]